MSQFSTEEKLTERIKELSCLYEVTNILNQLELTNEDVFVAIASRLKEAWRFSEKAIVEISFKDLYFSTNEKSAKTIFVKDSSKNLSKFIYENDSLTINKFEEWKKLKIDKIVKVLESF